MSEYRDFGLEFEHEQFRDQFRRFVRERLVPVAIEAEAGKTFPREIYRMLADQGYLVVNFPGDIGGGGDLLTGCIFYEELTRASAGISAGIFAHQHLALTPLLRFGTEEQKKQYLAPGLTGDVIGAFGLTEPDAGSDIRGIRTTAHRDGDDYVLNGSKLYITNGTLADFILVAARTGDGREQDSLTLFVVPTDTAGLSRTTLDKVGNHSSSTAFITFDDVRVPQTAVLGQPGAGIRQLKDTLVEGRILVSNRGLGIGEEACELITVYAGQRHAFGKPIAKFQGVSFKVAEMRVRADAARLMIYRAARLFMAGKTCDREASMAKFLASELAVSAATTGLLLHGGAGYMEGMKIARLFRDAPEAWIGEGTNEIQLHVVAKTMGLL